MNEEDHQAVMDTLTSMSEQGHSNETNHSTANYGNLNDHIERFFKTIDFFQNGGAPRDKGTPLAAEWGKSRTEFMMAYSAIFDMRAAGVRKHGERWKEGDPHHCARFRTSTKWLLDHMRDYNWRRALLLVIDQYADVLKSWDRSLSRRRT
ncbi:hypothetical protein KEM54_006706 [Ascosphaera aggregata]|nr:hypothetical protein KEM54_006706 [Ascosphaera aggregata]